MATSPKDSNPVCDESFLMTMRAHLVEHVVPENVLPTVKPFLLYTQVDAICAEQNRGDKIRSVLDIIQRQVNGREYGAFNAFILSLAGTQPDLFETVCGRSPTVRESDYSVTEVSQGLKSIIDRSEHQTDSDLDEKIDFQYEYLELAMVDKTKEYQELDDQGAKLPHEYSSHLDEVCSSNRNISANNILGDEKRPYRQVSVYGRGGIGKSTTFQCWAKLWAQGEWAAGFTMLFLLQLRFITNQVMAITTVELLQWYGLYDFPDQPGSTAFTSWLRNSASRIVILIDGLDEIPGFAERMRNTPKIHDVLQKAHPVDLCINILRGDLLPGCTVISASRQFAGLSQLRADARAEILGLTSEKVTEYVNHRHPDHLTDIMAVLSRNPILLSVCSITFYCMQITRLLSEGVTILDEDVATYSRLMAFIVVNYCSRKLTDSSFVMDVAAYFPKLAHLAYCGIFERADNTGLAKIVFDEDDMSKSMMNTQDLEKMKKTGIIQVTRRKIGRHESWTAEFFHLSAQELLAVAYFLSHHPLTNQKLKQLFQSGQFNLALQFIFGLHFDRNNIGIRKICTVVCPQFESRNIEPELSSFIDSILDQKLKVCQLLHEGQWREKAMEVVSQIAPGGELVIQGMSMTAIDLLAVDYVCQVEALTRINFVKVQADATFVDVLQSSLCEHHWETLQDLNLAENSIGDAGAVVIADSLHKGDPESKTLTLRTLNISGNKIGNEGAMALGSMLANNDNLEELYVGDNHQIGVEGVKHLVKALKQNTVLTLLQLHHSNASGTGAEAIGDMLQHNASLQVLDISRTRLRDGEIKLLADALHKNTTLTKLDLHSNKIGNAGAASLATMLSHNTGLQTLDMSRNHVGDEGARCIAESLYNNDSLLELDVSWSNIQVDGRRALTDVGNMRPHLHITCSVVGEHLWL